MRLITKVKVKVEVEVEVEVMVMFSRCRQINCALLGVVCMSIP